MFRALDLRRLKAALKSPVLVDLRNVYAPEEAAEAGVLVCERGAEVTLSSPT